MDFGTILSLLWSHWAEIVLFLLGLNFWTKLGRAQKLVKDALAASADKQLTTEEKALLFDDVYSLIKGFFPNKSATG